MSSQQLYRRFIAICQKWPKDETKVGRDYGEFLRAQINAKFPHGEVSHLENTKELDEALSALERIVDNKYFNETTLKRSSASGLETWACRAAVSTENLQLLQEQEESFLIKKLRDALSIKFVAEKKKD